MDSKIIVTDSEIKDLLLSVGFDHHVDEGRLMLAELLIKASSGFYNSHTEEAFMTRFGLLKRDRTLNKKGFRFLCAMFYNHSNKKPEVYFLMEKHRFD